MMRMVVSNSLVEGSFCSVFVFVPKYCVFWLARFYERGGASQLVQTLFLRKNFEVFPVSARDYFYSSVPFCLFFYAVQIPMWVADPQLFIFLLCDE